MTNFSHPWQTPKSQRWDRHISLEVRFMIQLIINNIPYFPPGEEGVRWSVQQLNKEGGKNK